MNEGHSHGWKTIILILAGILLLVLVLLASIRENGSLAFWKSTETPKPTRKVTPTFNKTWVPNPTLDVDKCHINEDRRLMSRFGDDIARYAFWLDDGKLAVTGISQSYGHYADMFEYYFCYTNVTGSGLITEFDGTVRFASNVSDIESLLEHYVDLDDVAGAVYSGDYQKILYQNRNAKYSLDTHDDTQFHMFYPHYDLWIIDLATQTQQKILPTYFEYSLTPPEYTQWVNNSFVYIQYEDGYIGHFIDLSSGDEYIFPESTYIHQTQVSTTRNQAAVIVSEGYPPDGNGTYQIYLYNLNDLSLLGSQEAFDNNRPYLKLEEIQEPIKILPINVYYDLSYEWPLRWGETSGNLYFFEQDSDSGELIGLMRYGIESDVKELVFSAGELKQIFPYPDDTLRFDISPDENFVVFYTYWYSKIYVAEIND